MGMRGAVLTGILMLAGGAAQADEPWTGIWAADPAWCVWADRVGSHNPAPIEITETEVNGLENFCAITSVTQIGQMNAWRLVLECSSEGDTYDDATLVMLESRDILWRWFGAGEPVRFTRC
jgi:hypothetical protein